MSLSISAKQRAAERSREWRKHNKEWRSEPAKELKRERQREYYKRNSGKHRAYYKAREQQIQMQPIYLLYIEEVQAIYDEAQRVTVKTGIPHVVDHIWPIKGKNSCGLHVPWNMRIITSAENDSKGNKEPSSSQFHVSFPA